MNSYIKFIEENLEYVEKLREQIVLYERVYKKRVFDLQWSTSIKQILDGIKQEIKRNLEECQYYLKRIEEKKNELPETSIPQSEENREDVKGEEGFTCDTYQDIART